MPSLDFDLSGVQTNNYEPLPKGWYTAKAEEASLNDNSSGTGQYIKLEFIILDAPDPKHIGRKVFANLNVFHSGSPVAEQIGRSDLKALRIATGLNGEISGTTEELVGRPLEIMLTVKSDPQYGDKNEVKGYRPSRSAQAQAPAPAASAPPVWKQ